MIVKAGHRKLGGKFSHLRLQMLAPGFHASVGVQHVVEVLQLLCRALDMVGDGHCFVDQVNHLLKVSFDEAARSEGWGSEPNTSWDKGALILRDAVLVEGDVHLIKKI